MRALATSAVGRSKSHCSACQKARACYLGLGFRVLGLGFRVYRDNFGASIIRIGFWGPVYKKYNKEPPK